MITSDLKPVERTARCSSCGERHVAEYHHEGSYGEGPIYGVTCPLDGLTDFVTKEGLDA